MELSKELLNWYVGERLNKGIKEHTSFKGFIRAYERLTDRSHYKLKDKK